MRCTIRCCLAVNHLSFNLETQDDDEAMMVARQLWDTGQYTAISVYTDGGDDVGPSHTFEGDISGFKIRVNDGQFRQLISCLNYTLANARLHGHENVLKIAQEVTDVVSRVEPMEALTRLRTDISRRKP